MFKEILEGKNVKIGFCNCLKKRNDGVRDSEQDKNRDLLTISQQMLSFSLRYNFVNDLEAPEKIEISREELKIASSFRKVEALIGVLK